MKSKYCNKGYHPNNKIQTSSKKIQTLILLLLILLILLILLLLLLLLQAHCPLFDNVKVNQKEAIYFFEWHTSRSVLKWKQLSGLFFILFLESKLPDSSCV